jgi:putative transcriptional regulator
VCEKSKPVFAHRTKTLQKWEQGLAKTYAQASLLIKMIDRFPDTVEGLTLHKQSN